ncbi:MAG TPA: alpha/beta fold hydrolase, partial [Thermoanaerobaculia bacterium]|nr:alpha/beta fold hydrolase [Thermoanaerobaculia bacterium]
MWRCVVAGAFSFVACTTAIPRGTAVDLQPCGPEDDRAAIRCGSLSVPENPDRPDGQQIRLHFAVVPAEQPRPGAAPLFILEGGPGIAASEGGSFFLAEGSEYRRDRDVVLVDQRGTGRSNPLRCPASERLGPLQPLYTVAAVEACRDDLEKIADLTMYSTEIAAGDLDRVRHALGHDQIDIWSLSYGTRLALTYIKRDPARVRSAVLVGFAPLDYRTPLYHAAAAQRVLDLVFYSCQMEPACSARYPDLRREWDGLLERFDGGPIRIGDAGVARGPFTEALRGILTMAAGQRALPRIITRAAAGDFEP